MAFAVVSYLLMQQDFNEQRVQRKRLRDQSNPLELPESYFVDQYRLNKSAFVHLLHSIEPHIQVGSIPLNIQLAATLRFLAEGSYQRSVGNDSRVSVARSTVSEILTRILPIIEKHVCPEWVSLNMSGQEKQQNRDYFYNKYKLPGIIGCIDGTHVRLMKPVVDEHLYFNRKGYFSMNTMIICDSNMLIRAVDARYPGSSHDSFVWNISSSGHFFKNLYLSGERAFRLLGDCGYAIEPFLLTPYRTPSYNSPQDRFNKAHMSARNLVERTIGVLKSRFRCLGSTLHYSPEKVVTIINVCCSLHNICRHYNIDYLSNNEHPSSEDDDAEVASSTPQNSSLQSEGQQIRDQICAQLSQS